ncbi:hypothetical protein OK016_19860 [Vibrio chagasii]|nr:hypothetical protein [Vibrio chagasii]
MLGRQNQQKYVTQTAYNWEQTLNELLKAKLMSLKLNWLLKSKEHISHPAPLSCFTVRFQMRKETLNSSKSLRKHAKQDTASRLTANVLPLNCFNKVLERLHTIGTGWRVLVGALTK